MRAVEFGEYLGEISPGLGSEEGFRFGDCNAEVKGILVAWMATAAAIKKAIDERCNFMIVHEDLFYPYGFQRGEDFETCLGWTVNYKRLKMLSEHDITVFRAHGTLDRLCILDDFAQALGLPESTVKEGYIRIYDVPETTVGELASKIKDRLSIEHIRLVGDPSRKVRRIGLPWGGLGLSLNIGFVEELLRYDPDLLIAGETDEYAMYYARDAGVCMIETGHSLSENIGLRRFVQTLRQHYPRVKVVFHDCSKPWKSI